MIGANMEQRVNLIAAVGKSGQLGLDGRLPWHDVNDLALFQRLTMGGTVIVGGRTAIGMPYLPGRKVLVFHGRHMFPNEVLDQLKADGHREPVWIAGGEHTYRAFAPFVNGLKLISMIDYDGPADTWFPFDAYEVEVSTRALAEAEREGEKGDEPRNIYRSEQ